MDHAPALDHALCHAHLCACLAALLRRSWCCRRRRPLVLPGVHGRKFEANQRRERPCTRARVWKAARSITRGRTTHALLFPPLRPLRCLPLPPPTCSLTAPVCQAGFVGILTLLHFELC